MVRSGQVQRRRLTRILAASLLVLVLVIGGALALLTFAADAIDRMQIQSERDLAQTRLDRDLASVGTDITNATVWSDMAWSLAQPVEDDWIQVNFGDYFADYMGHAVTLTYLPDGTLRHASRDSEQTTLEAEAAFAAAVQPLVAAVRAESAAQRRQPRTYGFDAVVVRTGVVEAGGRFYLAAASSVVAEDASVDWPTVDPVIVSGEPLTGVLTRLRTDLDLAGARFEPGATVAERGAIVVRGIDDQALGVIRWRPKHPGMGILAEAAPWIIGLMLALGAAAVVLLRHVLALMRQLRDNEAELVSARDRAEAANVAKSRFLSNMSHELRTPLNGVLGMAQIMEMDALSPQQAERLAVLKRSGEDLLAMIEHILTVSRLDKGELELVVAEFDIADLLAEARARHAERAAAKGLRLDCRIETGAQGVWRGDAGRLAQVLNYLLDNAVAYTDEGQITVSVAVAPDGVALTVADTGPGIAPERQAELFGRFTQGDDSTTRAVDGAGLGLSICRDLAQAMGGSIGLRSAPGAGAAFTVTVPLERALLPETVSQDA